MKKYKDTEAIQGIEYLSEHRLKPTWNAVQEINCTKFRKQKTKKGIIFETMAHICGNIDRKLFLQVLGHTRYKK